MSLYSIFRCVLISSLTGSVMAAMILLVKALLKKRMSFSWHYYIWFLLIIRLLIPYAPESPISVYNLFSLPPQNEIVLQEDVKAGDANNLNVNEPSKGTAGTAAVSSMDDSSDTKAPEQGKTDDSQGGFTFGVETLAWIWLTGAAAFLIYILIINLRLQIKLRGKSQCDDSEILEVFRSCKSIMNIHSNIPVIYDSSINAPFLMGVIKPRLLISYEMLHKLTNSERKYVFLHELGHLKRKDILVNWLTAILQSVHWFNPFIWYSFHRMRDDCEVACDSYALSYIEPGEHKSYGEAIVSLLRAISKPVYRPGVAGMAGHMSSVKKRISAIMNIKKLSFKWYIIAGAAFLLIGCTGLTSSQTNSGTQNIPTESQKNTEAVPEVSESQGSGETLFNKDNEFLLRALSRNIKKDPEKITKKDLQDVTLFFIYDDIKNDLKDRGFNLDEAYDFSLIQDMPNLESLQIDGIRLKDYSVFKDLPKLGSLGISYLDDTSAKIIGGITSLKAITIMDSSITSIDFLSNCSNIWYLSLKNTPDIKSFDVLKSLGQLKYLELNGLKLDGSKLAVLPDMGKLETLKLNGNNIKSVSSLPSMPTLFELYLDGNPVQNVSIPVNKVPQLGFLSLQNTPIDSINKIKGTDNLAELDIRGSSIKYVAPIRDIKKSGGLKKLQTIYLLKKDINDLDTLKDTGIGVLEIKLG